MGMLAAAIFGTKCPVVHYDWDFNETRMYVLGSGNKMWLASSRLDQVHEYMRPSAKVLRLDDGPRTWRGIDKGRWFVALRDDAVEQKDPIGEVAFYCYNEQEARRIERMASQVRESYEARHPDEAVPASIEGLLARSDAGLKRSRALLASERFSPIPKVEQQ